ncbi:LysR family transcriptional regulator [Polaromonas sp. JS666]|uniref:LysR family transcriptional regulator n=1 Tax=Polaromonas sp. (strain JS666 / ATCC BAA-500) TaxID=296591 RepID=UPI0000464844|nr:LysR family transcriptional regulator [Polaromonas sp. JS666]ABE44626.1 transcriptional regulator, LysR family [Polaromonas sp. JS666]
MRHSPEALTAFAEAATLGSFSAAARKLGKSQSTVSSAIANLEIDLGLALFDRSSRKPTLTEGGRVVLGKVQEILAASDRLDRAASQLAGGLEARLSVVWSDTYQSDRFENMLMAFEQRFPDLEFECLIAEHGDLVSLVQTGRAQIGVVAAQNVYPPDIGAAMLAEQSEITLFVATNHPLAGLKDITPEVLANFRQLRLDTYLEPADQSAPSARRAWSAPSYLMLLEMAVLGFGWAAIPRWMVTRFAVGSLHELDARGWPQRVPVDAVWSRQRPLGRAGTWLLQEMLAPLAPPVRALSRK